MSNSIYHAIWKGELVEALDEGVRSGEKSGFVCVNCDKPLILKKDALFPHFVHASKSFCYPESRIHKTVKLWIEGALPSNIFPLPPHPVLKNPCEFLAYKCETEFYDNSKGEINEFDIRALGSFSYSYDVSKYINRESFLYDFGGEPVEHSYYWNPDFYRGDANSLDANRVLDFYRYLTWSGEYYSKELRDTFASPSKGKSSDEMLDRMTTYTKIMYPIKHLYKDHFKRKPATVRETHPYFWKNEIFQKIKIESKKCDQLIIEVKHKNKKNDKFKSKVQKKGYYVLEVDTEDFYGISRGLNGQGLSILHLIKNSEWLWFTDAERKQEQSKGQTGLFV